MTTDIQNIAQLQGMTSLQIAEATEKNHKEVLRDIRALLDKGVNERNFALVDYTDKKGQKRPMYTLTPKGCLILASGYDPVLREKIIDKLEELTMQERRNQEEAVREMEALPAPARYSASVQEVEASIRWIEYQRTTLGLDKRQVHRLMKREGKRLGVPVAGNLQTAGNSPTAAVHFWPNSLNSATELLDFFGINAKTTEFNKEMVRHGLLVEVRTSGMKKKSFKQLTKAGLSFGINRPVKNGNGETWPFYYKDTFFDLCKALGFGIDEQRCPF